MENLLRVKMAA